MIDKRRDAFWRGKPDDGKKAPAGRLMPGADGLMPVKGSDAASDDSSRRPGKGRQKARKTEVLRANGEYQTQR